MKRPRACEPPPQAYSARVTAAAISLRALVKDYGSTRALNGIDLDVEPGQVFGFLGPNGAGKTTTIRIMLDLLRPTAGTATVLGYDSRRESIDVRRRCGYLPGDLRLYDGMRGNEFLDLIDSFRPERRDPRYRLQIIERLDVDVTRAIGTLSKGNRQKIGLVQALMHRPDLLILDEPTSGLDPLVQQQVGHLLDEVVHDGRTVFFSSHVLSEVERLSHAVAIIRAGEIVAVEDVGAMKSRAVHVVEVTFAEEPPLHAFSALPGVTELQRQGPLVRLQSHDGIDALVKRIAQYSVVDLRTEQPSLEDAFLAFYSGDRDAQPPEARDVAS